MMSTVIQCGFFQAFLAVYVLFSFQILLCFIKNVDMTEDISKHEINSSSKILIFGGNGFMGAETVEKLLKLGAKIFLINRGNWYWDSASRIKPHVQHFKCDRYEPLKNCPGLLILLDQISIFDAVIDFSLYRKDGLLTVLPVLKNKVKLYIYISTDSIYEVCHINRKEAIKEIDANRPELEEEVKRLEKVSWYGHRKLECEEMLRSQRKDGGFPFVFLRIPDVIGPRDTTKRSWTYQIWMMFYKYINKPIFLNSKIANVKTSLAYVSDVANIIIKILEAGEKAHDKAFNVALHGHFTLKGILENLQEALEINNVDYDHHSLSGVFHLYPSFTKGPLDISLAEKILSFQPTPWKEVLNKTISFYKNALLKFPQERDQAARILFDHVVEEWRKPRFKEALEKYPEYVPVEPPKTEL